QSQGTARHPRAPGHGSDSPLDPPSHPGAQVRQPALADADARSHRRRGGHAGRFSTPTQRAAPAAHPGKTEATCCPAPRSEGPLPSFGPCIRARTRARRGCRGALATQGSGLASVLFNSFVFLGLFLPITYIVFWSLRTAKARYVWLTITGYVFY